MKTIEELRDYLLENYINEWGNLDMRGLDFSDFEGNVYINDMKVKGNLDQSAQNVQGNLYNLYSQYGGKLLEEPSTKLLKVISPKELAEMGYKVGYIIKGEN